MKQAEVLPIENTFEKLHNMSILTEQSPILRKDIDDPDGLDWKEDYLPTYGPEPLKEHQLNSIVTVVGEICDNEQLDLKYRQKVKQALDLFVIGGDFGVPLDKLKSLFTYSYNPDTEMHKLMGTLNNGLKKLADDGGASFIIQIAPSFNPKGYEVAKLVGAWVLSTNIDEL